MGRRLRRIQTCNPAVGQIVRAAKAAGLEVQFVGRKELDRAAGGGRHQGVGAKVFYEAGESFGAYLDMLEADPHLREWEAFTNALTTNLTAFFREGHHFPILREHLLASKHRHPLVVWCAAASTGARADIRPTASAPAPCRGGSWRAR